MVKSLLHLPCDVQQIDDTGFVWTFLDRATVPQRVVAGNLIISGDDEAPVVARVIDLLPMTATDGTARTVVHLEIVGVPEEYLEVLQGFPVSV